MSQGRLLIKNTIRFSLQLIQNQQTQLVCQSLHNTAKPCLVGLPQTLSPAKETFFLFAIITLQYYNFEIFFSNDSCSSSFSHFRLI